MKIYCFILISVLFLAASVKAQDTSIDSLYRTSEYKLPKLPPFSVLYDTIMSRSPQKLKLQKTRLDALYNLGLVKKEWLNYFSLGSSFSYGKGVGLGSSQSGGTVLTSLSNTTTSSYGGGLSLGFSLGTLVTYKTKVKISKIKVDQAQLELQAFEQEFKFKLYEQYTQLDNNLNTFKAASITMEMHNAQVIMSEKQFRLGRINLQQLIGARQTFDVAVSNFENLKRNCKIGIYYFEQLSGMDFQKDRNSTILEPEQ